MYDAWGNHEILIDVDGIGSLNPIRYRGYYFDIETGLYSVGLRYYDPEVGRWINADDIKYLNPNAVNGLNLYSYCLNNPVMMIDSAGTTAVPNAGIRGFSLRISTMIPNYNFNLQLIAQNLPFANVVNRFSYTNSLIKDPFLSALIGNISVTTTFQPRDAGWFYAYSDIGNGFVGYGAGINLGGIAGFEVGVTAGSFWDLGINAGFNLGPVSFGGSIGTSGIGINFGLTIGNNTTTISVNAGWGTLGLVAIGAYVGGPIGAGLGWLLGRLLGI